MTSSTDNEFPIPKPKDDPTYFKKKRKPKIVEKERDHIQPAIDDYVKVLKNGNYLNRIRIPDLVYEAIKYHPHLRDFQKKMIMAYLRSIPDNVFIKPSTDGYNSCLCLEIKTVGNKMTQGQRLWAKDSNVQVVTTFRDGAQEIEKWLNSAGS